MHFAFNVVVDALLVLKVVKKTCNTFLPVIPCEELIQQRVAYLAANTENLSSSIF